MARKTVANLRDSVSGILTGLELNNVTNLNGALERTARELATRIYIPDTETHQSLTLYDGVTDYTAPTDIYGAGLIDLAPQGISRTILDYVIKQPQAVWDRTKAYLENGTHIAFSFIKGVGRIRIVSSRPTPKIELDPLTATTGWTAAGSASGLTKDSTVFWQSPAALRMLLTRNAVVTLTKTIPSQDFTNYTGVGVVFLAIRTPDATNLSSIAVRLGSSSSAYYSVSSTTGFLGAWTVNDWLLVALDLSTATTTGSPTATAITYAQIRVTHAATITNFYVGQLFISLPSPQDLIYQAASFFQTSGSNPSQTITNTGDSVLLNDAAYVIYEYECASTIAQQQGGTLSSGIIAEIDSKLNGKRARNGMIVQLGLYDIYRGENPKQELRSISNYLDD